MSTTKSGKKRHKRRTQNTPRQNIFVKELAKGSTLTDAAIAANYSPKNPGQSGYQALKNLRWRGSDLLARHELDEDILIEKHLKPKLTKKKTVFFQHEGKVTDQREVDALETQNWALDAALKIHGTYAPTIYDNKGAAGPNVQIIVDLPGPDWSKPPNNKTTIRDPAIEFLIVHTYIRRYIPWDIDKLLESVARSAVDSPSATREKSALGLQERSRLGLLCEQTEALATLGTRYTNFLARARSFTKHRRN